MVVNVAIYHGELFSWVISRNIFILFQNKIASFLNQDINICNNFFWINRTAGQHFNEFNHFL